MKVQELFEGKSDQPKIYLTIPPSATKLLALSKKKQLDAIFGGDDEDDEESKASFIWNQNVVTVEYILKNKDGQIVVYPMAETFQGDVNSATRILQKKFDAWCLKFERQLVGEGIIQEGTWAVPNTVEKAVKLIGLLQQRLPLSTAEKKLFNLLGDDELFDKLGDLKDAAKKDKSKADTDVSAIVVKRLKTLLRSEWQDLNPDAEVILKTFVKKYK